MLFRWNLLVVAVHSTAGLAFLGGPAGLPSMLLFLSIVIVTLLVIPRIWSAPGRDPSPPAAPNRSRPLPCRNRRLRVRI